MLEIAEESYHFQNFTSHLILSFVAMVRGYGLARSLLKASNFGFHQYLWIIQHEYTQKYFNNIFRGSIYVQYKMSFKLKGICWSK